MTIILRELDSYITTEFGRVDDPPHGEGHYVGSGRLCVHAIRMTNVFFCSTAFVNLIGWQPVVCDKHPRQVCIASKRDGVLSFAYDAVGPWTDGMRGHYWESPTYREFFDLHPVQWWDEDEPSENVMLAVRRLAP